MKISTFEEAVKLLKELQAEAIDVDRYKDDCCIDYNQIARMSQIEIIDTLLSLELPEEVKQNKVEEETRTKYKIGDRVKIVDRWNRGCHENSGGEMDKWLGKTMTIRDICDESSDGPCYRMVEDIGDNPFRDGWYWYESAIAGLAK